MRVFLKAGLIAAVAPGLIVMASRRPVVVAGGVAAHVMASVAPAGVPVLQARRRPLLAAATLGLASWYGSMMDGQRTANGETFDSTAMTACHKTLPFGTMVRVIDVANGRSVIVRITDRGVLTSKRIIDLSSGAAGELGILKAGVAKVRLEVLGRVKPGSGRIAHL